MDRSTLILLCICAAAIGCFYLAIERGFLVINLQSRVSNQATTLPEFEKKPITLTYWHNDRWMHEQVEIIWSDNCQQTVKHMVDAWLTLLDDERIMDKKVTLQSCLCSSNQQELLLSFDRNPFPVQASTYEKWMWIEGLLKTIRDNGIKVQAVRFLVHHQELHDYHLDFTNSWPINGFIKH